MDIRVSVPPLLTPHPPFRNPSRSTVDANGGVWTGNRDEWGNGLGSVVHIGLKELGQCVDRNGDGKITTSTVMYRVPTSAIVAF